MAAHLCDWHRIKRAVLKWATWETLTGFNVFGEVELNNNIFLILELLFEVIFSYQLQDTRLISSKTKSLRIFSITCWDILEAISSRWFLKRYQQFQLVDFLQEHFNTKKIIFSTFINKLNSP